MPYSTSSIIVTLKSPLGVVQGDWKWCRSIDHIRLCYWLLRGLLQLEVCMPLQRGLQLLIMIKLAIWNSFAESITLHWWFVTCLWLCLSTSSSICCFIVFIVFYFHFILGSFSSMRVCVLVYFFVIYCQLWRNKRGIVTIAPSFAIFELFDVQNIMTL